MLVGKDSGSGRGRREFPASVSSAGMDQPHSGQMPLTLPHEVVAADLATLEAPGTDLLGQTVL